MPFIRFLVLALPSLLLVFWIWLPFGLRLTGLIEEWDVLGLFTVAGSFFVIYPGTPLAAHAMRPLTVLPQAIAHALGPDSFTSWNVALAAAIWLKGTSATLLARRTGFAPGWAALFGLLFVVYPADTMQLSFRSLHINWSLGCMLAASAFTFAAWDAQSAASRICLATASAVLLAIATLMYEVAVALTPLPFLLLWAREGSREAFFRLRAGWGVTLSWIGLIALYCAYAMWIVHGGSSYQQSVAASQTPMQLLVNAVPQLFFVGLMRAFVGGWADAFGMVKIEYHHRTYLLIAAAAASLIAFAGATASIKNANVGGSTLRAVLLRCACAGVVLAACGYVPYLFSPAHVMITQRTYLFSAVGASLSITALVILVGIRSRVAASLISAALVALGLGAEGFQFQHYVTIAQAQRAALRSIVESFNGDLNGRTLLLLDHSNRFSHTWFLRDNLSWALSYLYNRQFDKVEICLMPGGSWQRLNALQQAGSCRRGNSGWLLEPPRDSASTYDGAKPVGTLQLPDNEVKVIEIAQDGSVINPAPDPGYLEWLRSASDPAAFRYRKILTMPDKHTRFKLFEPRTPLSDRYYWDFGHWWSLENPTRGEGWREADWSATGLGRSASAWKTQVDGQMLFDLIPSHGPYRLQVHFDAVVSEAVRAGTRLRINEKDLALQWKGADEVSALVSDGVLRAGVNVLEIVSPVDQSYFNLSLKMERFEIMPSTPPANWTRENAFSGIPLATQATQKP